MQYKSEAHFQQELFVWFWNNFPDFRGCLFHVPNGGGRDKIEGARLKAIGVIAGVPDLILAIKGKVFFLELKTPLGKLSEQQIREHARLRKGGNKVFILRDLQKAKRLITFIVDLNSRL